MNKILLALSVLLAATMANASYLYWQVDSSDYTDDVTGANVWYSTDGGATKTKLTTYGLDEDTGNIVAIANPEPDVLYAIDMSDSTWNESYSYYIEVANSTGSVYSDGITGSDLWQSYAAAGGNATSDLGGVATANVVTWHGGTTVVPEPTSAILMLFGAAFLGLKRKNRSLA
jgi:Na+-transporting NADH:ubiquinone oxidoreductase subunit NqrB